MGAYEYRALDQNGREKKGLLEGDTARAVRQMLREKKLLPVDVTEVAERRTRKKKESRAFSVGSGLSGTELALITRQLATMFRAGLPLDEALQAVAEQNEKPRPKKILLGVRARVLEGHTMASGLGDYPKAFPDLYRATVAAGEQSGNLDGVLERLADYAESQQTMRGKVLEAMVYPIFLTLAAVGIVVFLLLTVVPPVVQVFEDMKMEVPFLTRALIMMSAFLQDYGFFLFIGLSAIGFGIYMLLKQTGPRRAWHRTLLKMPVVGGFVRAANTAQFARTLSIMASSGVPVITAMGIASSVVTNLPMREAIDVAAERVREGASIAKSLDVSKIFPPMTMRLISSGEASGELDDMLLRAADSQEQELETLRKMLTSLLAPFMVLVMGGIVLVIVMAILLPIFELNTSTF
ncbi:MAG: type II secretion system inner membrane protein GspF [Gammaproteobacteria bacterium]